MSLISEHCLKTYNPEGKSFSDETVAEEVVQATKDLCGTCQFPMILKMSNLRELKWEERNYYKNQKPDCITHLAIIASNPYQRLIGNLFIGLNRLNIPCKIFEDEAACIEWFEKLSTQK